MKTDRKSKYTENRRILISPRLKASYDPDGGRDWHVVVPHRSSFLNKQPWFCTDGLLRVLPGMVRNNRVWVFATDRRLIGRCSRRSRMYLLGEVKANFKLISAETERFIEEAESEGLKYIYFSLDGPNDD